MKTYRQGDVLIRQVAAIPAASQLGTPDAQNKIVLALGEATGHHHRIENVKVGEHESARIFSFGAERFLQVMESVALRHEEHSTIQLPPGNYQIAIQIEYTP